jgi:hypothetical protein
MKWLVSGLALFGAAVIAWLGVAWALGVVARRPDDLVR